MLSLTIEARYIRRYGVQEMCQLVPIGIIDHELEKIRGDLDRMDDLFSIQLDQDSKISQLESRINQLEATLNQLKQLVESLNKRFNNLVRRFNLHIAEHAKRGEK